MASIYTYDQFEQAARKAGLLDKFSQADLNLARQNADAGMSILKYKQDWNNATTDEARALANLGAEQIRSSYGNYTGGSDGGSFHLNPMSPGSFQAQETPTYENRYDERTQQLIDSILNREQFSYDPATDPSAQAYQKQYAREGQRATQDTLAAASVGTGGAPSSYAVTAASQAGDYYAGQMADKIPELYQQAYDRYLQEYNAKLQDLGMLQQAEQLDYDKFREQLGQYNTDRQFQYGQLTDELTSQRNEWYDRLDKAELAGEYGDYSFLNDLGINTDWQKQYQMALLKAEYGDYSGLRELGIDTSNNSTERDWQYQLALLKAEYGDYSGLRELGIDPSGAGTSGGSSYSGGYSSGSGSSGGQQDVEQDTSAAVEGMDDSMIDEIWWAYPGGVISARGLQQLQSKYPGLTRQMLQAAGFSVESGGGSQGSGGGSNNRTNMGV